jgi:hypothetical protein
LCYRSDVVISATQRHKHRRQPHLLMRPFIYTENYFECHR